MNFYTGVNAGGICAVFKNGTILPPSKSQLVYNHSPDGFNWGYTGSGPAQLALALLLEEMPLPFAMRLYQLFKEDVVARLPAKSWIITSHQIGGWLTLRRKELEEYHERMTHNLSAAFCLEEIVAVDYFEQGKETD